MCLFIAWQCALRLQEVCKHTNFGEHNTVLHSDVHGGNLRKSIEYVLVLIKHDERFML